MGCFFLYIQPINVLNKPKESNLNFDHEPHGDSLEKHGINMTVVSYL